MRGVLKVLCANMFEIMSDLEFYTVYDIIYNFDVKYITCVKWIVSGMQ